MSEQLEMTLPEVAAFEAQRNERERYQTALIDMAMREHGGIDTQLAVYGVRLFNS